MRDFKAGDRVMNLGGRDSQIPEGAKGTLLGLSPYQGDEQTWEVEYDGLPCPHENRSRVIGARSETSWFSRASRIVLMAESIREEAA